MENENIKKIEKKLEELAEEAKNLGLSSTEEDLPLKIMRLVKKALDENDLDITITPMMYNPKDFMPILAVLVKEESAPYEKNTRYQLLRIKLDSNGG